MESELSLAFRDFLEALADPEGGERLYDRHARRAMLVMGTRAFPRPQIDRAEFAAAHRVAPSEVPAYGAATLTHWESTGPAQAQAHFELEGESGSFPVAAGFEAEDGAWRLVWTVVNPAPDLTYALGRAAMLAEFPFLGRPHLPARAWLDLGFGRHYRQPEPNLLLQEDAVFSCHGSSDCCRYEWGILVPPEAQEFIDALPLEEMGADLVGTRLLPNDKGQLVLKEHGEACRFQDEARRCRIHKLLGTPVFTPCIAFPFSFAETPDGVAVAASFFCGSVRHKLGLPLTQRTADLHGRLAQGGAHKTSRYMLASELEVPWEAFRQNEDVLRALVRCEDLTFHRRLWAGSRFLAAQVVQAPMDLATWTEEAIAPLDETEFAMVDTLLSLFVRFAGRTFDALSALDEGTVPHAEVRDVDWMARWYETVLHSKLLSYKWDLVTSQNLLAVVYLLVLKLQAAYPNGRLPEPAWTALGAFVSHGALRATIDTLAEDLPEFLDFLERPSSGLLLLRYPLSAARVLTDA